MEVAEDWDALGESALNDCDSSEAYWTDHEARMVPATLEGSGYSQEEITNTIQNAITSIHTSLSDYENIRPIDIKLSTLRDMYEKRDVQGAMDLVRQKRRLVVDDKFRYPSNHKDLCWTQEGVSRCTNCVVGKWTSVSTFSFRSI